MASPLTFLQQYHKDGSDFLSTGDDSWVSFVTVGTKEQSVDAHTFTK
jgi:hypothetical protein